MVIPGYRHDKVFKTGPTPSLPPLRVELSQFLNEKTVNEVIEHRFFLFIVFLCTVFLDDFRLPGQGTLNHTDDRRIHGFFREIQFCDDQFLKRLQPSCIGLLSLLL
ncbi:Uncharacterised protein [Klebsiella pneumoniae]|nr:Uncharacterised protein [Klebsiella pneumoniae]